jgi:serine/threonine-protein kinase
MGPGTDIYALGAILFEILALEPLHGRGTPDYLMASTLRGVDVAGAVRRAECDVAPELLAIVTRATAPDPAHRFETAREMQEELERFLNGDRDLERRRELARVHAGAAYDAAMRALEGGDSSEERSRAMREVSRAMALDPQNGEALKTLVRLMTDVPPRALPADAQREVDAQARDWQRTGSRIAGFAYLSWSLNAPLAYIMGVSSWPRIMTLEALWLAASWMSFHTSRHPHPAGKTGYSLIVVSNLAIACTAWLFGPFVLVPALAAVNAVSFVIGTDRSRRALAILLGCLAILLPLLLEWIGVDGRSYTFEGGRFVVWPRALAFPATPTLVFLVVTNILFFVTPALLIGRFKDVLSQTENRLYMQTWHLRQFVPNEASSIASARPASNASGAIAES